MFEKVVWIKYITTSRGIVRFWEMWAVRRRSYGPIKAFAASALTHTCAPCAHPYVDAANKACTKRSWPHGVSGPPVTRTAFAVNNIEERVERRPERDQETPIVLILLRTPPHPVRRSLFVRKQYSASMHRGLLYRLRGLVNKTRRRCDGRRPRGGATGHAAPRRPTGEPWPDRKTGEEGKGWFMAKAGDSQNLQAERVVGSDYDVSETRLK